MLIYLNGKDPRVECLQLLLAAAGHEFVPTLATAATWLCCQPPGFNGAKERHVTQQMIMEHCRDIAGPGTLCLVTMEPNDLWPANFCHITENTVRGNTGHHWEVTRAHYRTVLPERSSELILGANPSAVDVLREIFGPASDWQSPLPVQRVFAAELAAEKAIAISK